MTAGESPGRAGPVRQDPVSRRVIRWMWLALFCGLGVKMMTSGVFPILTGVPLAFLLSRRWVASHHVPREQITFWCSLVLLAPCFAGVAPAGYRSSTVMP